MPFMFRQFFCCFKSNILCFSASFSSRLRSFRFCLFCSCCNFNACARCRDTRQVILQADYFSHCFARKMMSKERTTRINYGRLVFVLYQMKTESTLLLPNANICYISIFIKLNAINVYKRIS